MTGRLTAEQQDWARRQGWTLADVYDTRGFVAQAVLPTPSSLFATPYQAFQFVWNRAKAGDDTCKRALQIVTADDMRGKSSLRKTKKKR